MPIDPPPDWPELYASQYFKTYINPKYQAIPLPPPPQLLLELQGGALIGMLRALVKFEIIDKGGCIPRVGGPARSYDDARGPFPLAHAPTLGVRLPPELLGKLNWFNSAHPFPGSTHNDTLIALIELLKEHGAKKITVADRSGMGDTHQVMEAKGIFELAQKLEFAAIPIDKLPPGEWEHVALPHSHCMVARYSVKDSYDYMMELHSSSYQREMIAEINLLYKPDLIVLDGLEAFVTGGPERGQIERPGVMLAATDRVALDAVGVAILRLYKTTPEVSRGKIFEHPQIKRAVELGLGARGSHEIEIVPAPDDDSKAFARQVREVLDRG